MDFATLTGYLGTNLVSSVFGSQLIAGSVLIIFIMLAEWKMGASSDVIMATLPILLIGLGTTILTTDVSGYFTGAVALVIGIILGVAVWKVLGK